MIHCGLTIKTKGKGRGKRRKILGHEESGVDPSRQEGPLVEDETPRLDLKVVPARDPKRSTLR